MVQVIHLLLLWEVRTQTFPLLLKGHGSWFICKRMNGALTVHAALGGLTLHWAMIRMRNEMNRVLGHLCADLHIADLYRLNWESWYELDDTALQTQDSKFEPRRSEAELATSRSRRLTTIFNLHHWAERIFFFNLKARVGFEPDFASR